MGVTGFMGVTKLEAVAGKVKTSKQKAQACKTKASLGVFLSSFLSAFLGTLKQG